MDMRIDLINHHLTSSFVIFRREVSSEVSFMCGSMRGEQDFLRRKS